MVTIRKIPGLPGWGRAAALVLLFSSFTLALTACDSSSGSGRAEGEVLDLLDDGRAWLAVGEGDKARLAFLEALAIAPDDPEALYGLVLSDTVHTVDVFSIIYDYILSFIEQGGPVTAQVLDKDESGFAGREGPEGWIDDLLDMIFHTLLLDRARELVDTSRICRTIPDIAYHHEGIPILIALEHVADLAGEFDSSELYAAEAFALLLDGLTSHLLVLDLDFDLSLAWRIADIDFECTPMPEAIGLVTAMLIDLVADPDYPGFLTMSTCGMEAFTDAGLRIGLGLDQWLRTFDAVAAETDDQADDIIGYEDLNGSGDFDHGEPFVIPHFGVLDAEEMEVLEGVLVLVASLRDSYLDDTSYDPDPETRSPFCLSAMNPLLEALGVPLAMPGSVQIDFGAIYANPRPWRLKTTLLAVLHLVQLIFPEP